MRRYIKGKFFFLIILLTFSSLHVNAQEWGRIETEVLPDGTTIIHIFDHTGTVVQEDIILKSGRRKSTFYGSDGKPKYGIVFTGTGSFGFVYYDQAEAPLFKFWDHGNNESVIQFYSADFTLMGEIEMKYADGERIISLEEFK